MLVRSCSFVPRRFSDSSGVPPNARVPWSNATLSRVKMLNEVLIWIQYIYVLDVYDIHIYIYIYFNIYVIQKETMCIWTQMNPLLI